MRVIFIVGSGRSGSTLVSSHLSLIYSSYLEVGEYLRYSIYQHEKVRAIPCGCGQEITNCMFWSDKQSLFTEPLMRNLYPYIRLGSFWRTFFLSKQEKIKIGEQLKTHLSNLSEENIIENSKNPLIAYYLSFAPDTIVEGYHVIYGSGNIVESWKKKKSYLPSKPGWRMFSLWIFENLFCYFILRNRLSKYAIWPFESKFSQLHQNPNIQHTIAGNPNKLSSSTKKITIQHQNILGKWIYRYLTRKCKED